MSYIEIKLRGPRDLVTKIDMEDFDRVSQFKWGSITRSVKPMYYAYTTHNSKLIRLHRFIMNCTNPDMIVHHKNGDILDNRKENLEIVTCAEHTKPNQKLAITPTTFTKGSNNDQ